jgi:glycerophosphoryl diester phosphodiesterase
LKSQIKKCLVAGVALVAFGLQAQAQQNPEARLDILFDQKNHNIYVTAHRGGDWRNDPENSLQSLKRAAALGVDIVEMDLKRTKDGQLVLMHDKTLDRTTTGSGPVSDHALDEVNTLTLRAGTHHQTSYKIPTFTQELVAAKENNVILDVDTGWDYFPQVMREVDANHAVGRVIVNVNPNTSLEDFQKLNGPLPATVTVMIVVEMKRPDAEHIIGSYIPHRRTIIQCIFADDQLSFLQHTKDIAHQFPVWMNGLWPEQNGGHDDDRAADLGQMDQSWGWLISHGARILQTDRPRELVDYLRKKDLAGN